MTICSVCELTEKVEELEGRIDELENQVEEVLTLSLEQTAEQLEAKLAEAEQLEAKLAEIITTKILDSLKPDLRIEFDGWHIGTFT